MTLREALDILELNPNSLDRQLLESTLRKNLENIELRNVMRLLEAYRKANAFINPTLATHGDVRVTMIDEPIADGPPLNQRPAAKRLADSNNLPRLKRDFAAGATFDESILRAPSVVNNPTLSEASVFATQEIMPNELPTQMARTPKANVSVVPVDHAPENKRVSLLWVVGVAAAGLAAIFTIMPVLSPSKKIQAVAPPVINKPVVTKPVITKPVVTKPATSSTTTKPATVPAKPVTPTTVTKPVTIATKPVASSTTTKPTTKPVAPSITAKPIIPKPQVAFIPKPVVDVAALERARVAAVQRREAARVARALEQRRLEVRAQRRLAAQREAAQLAAQRQATQLAARREAQQATARREAQQAAARREAQQAAARREVQRQAQKAASRQVTTSARVINRGAFNGWDRSGAVLRYPSWAAVPDSVRALPASQFRASVYVAASPASLPGIPR